MSTKNNPGAFRCYQAALPDEHVFTILARDPAGPATLEFWADERERVGKTKNPDDIDRITDARRDAELMRDWRAANLDPTGGGDPSWKLVRITDDEGGPIRTLPENVQYVPAERDGDEAVRLNVEWLRNRAKDLTAGRISRDDFAELIDLACRSPQKVEMKCPGRTFVFDADAMDETAIAITDEMSVSLTVLVDSYRSGIEAKSRPPVAETSRDVTEIDTPEMPPHRFAMFDKSEGWAYGRGLEINPAHIPAMLDRMEEDGYTLVAALGAQADKVGMIFQRGPRYSGFEIAHGTDGEPVYYEPRDGGRASEKSDRFLAGEPLDEIAKDDPPVAETLDETFVIEYVTKDSDGNCVRTRVPIDEWPHWAEPCLDRGRGQMP